eukprot:jgi/Orpsp1_1/1184241/evm.model.c7180000088666.3
MIKLLIEYANKNELILFYEENTKVKNSEIAELIKKYESHNKKIINEYKEQIDKRKEKERIEKENFEKKLLEKGLEEINDNTKFSPLMLACYFNDEEWVKVLIEQKYDINIKNKNGDTPLTIACYFNNKNIIELLINNGANVNVKNNNGETPINILKKFENNEEIINILNILEDYKYKRRYEKPIVCDELQKVFNNSVFQIEYSENINKTILGTGFFIQLPIPSENDPIYGLMTCNHVLNLKQFNSRNEFKIIFKNINKEFKITIDDSYFIFTSKLIDITFIQFTEDLINKLNINKEYFLVPCYNDKINDKIFILHYFKSEDLLIDCVKIKSCYGFDYFHECLTDVGSSGSPLINEYFEIIDIHKAKRKVSNENMINVATRINTIEYAIRTLYNNINKSKIDNNKARLSPKTLSNDEIYKLNKQGLEQKIDKVFVIPKLDGYSELYLYRTNHAWYWTDKLSENEYDNENEIDKYKIKNLKKSKWTVIKSINEDDNDINYKSIGKLQKIIIEFIGL